MRNVITRHQNPSHSFWKIRKSWILGTSKTDQIVLICRLFRLCYAHMYGRTFPYVSYDLAQILCKRLVNFKNKVLHNYMSNSHVDSVLYLEIKDTFMIWSDKKPSCIQC